MFGGRLIVAPGILDSCTRSDAHGSTTPICEGMMSNPKEAVIVTARNLEHRHAKEPVNCASELRELVYLFLSFYFALYSSFNTSERKKSVLPAELCNLLNSLDQKESSCNE